MTPLQLKVQRKRLGISQFELAKKSKINRYRINHFECGYLKLTEEEVEQISSIVKPKGASHNGNSNKKS